MISEKPIRTGLRAVKCIYKLGMIKGLSAFIKMTFGNEITSIQLNKYKSPFYLRPKTSDAHVFEHVFLDTEYELKIQGLDPRLIIDGGANIGSTSVYFANLFPNATIIAVEPDAHNYSILLRNTKPYANIVPVQGAIWNYNTSLKIQNPNDASWSFRMEEAANTGNGELIKAYTVSDLIHMSKKDKVDILKLDIEGGEKELFDSNYEIWLDKVHIVIAELHDRLVEGCSNSFYKAITKYRFKQFLKGWNVIIIKEGKL